MKNKRKIDVCSTPLLLPLFNIRDTTVIVIDVFRATSAMCVFLNQEGSEVIPVSTIEEAEKYKKKEYNLNGEKYLVAAERNGSIVPGFDLGNSPLLYHGKNFKNKSLVITTTNGTLAIEESKQVDQGMLIASFLNVDAVIKHVSLNLDSNILIVCSGWKGRMCVEDLLLAGLISNKLLNNGDFESSSDSVFLAQKMYNLGEHDMFSFLKSTSYMNRMKFNEDIEYCLQYNTMDIVPCWYTDNSVSGCFRKFSNI